jgi:hypothetical protein
MIWCGVATAHREKASSYSPRMVTEQSEHGYLASQKASPQKLKKPV